MCKGKLPCLCVQMMVEHPRLPTTRVAVWLPTLAFHFSPARYRRIMRALHVLFPPQTEPLSAAASTEPLGSPRGANLDSAMGVPMAPSLSGAEGGPTALLSASPSSAGVPMWHQPDFSGMAWVLTWEVSSLHCDSSGKEYYLYY